MSIEEYQNYGKEIIRTLFIRNSPISVKMLTSEDEIPERAVRPNRDRGHHIAQCQAFALSRRQGETVAMLKEDHWCFAPLMAYGLVDDPKDDFVSAVTSFPSFERGKYIGMLTGPMESAEFEPDLVMLYVEPGQVRKLLMIVKMVDKVKVTAELDPIDSCAYAVVPVIEKEEYKVAIPDPGEYHRAAVREDELIFSIPKSKISTIVNALTRMKDNESEDKFKDIEMVPDFRRPDFYDKVFKTWGLDTSEDLKK